jgi:hypothetical protein
MNFKKRKIRTDKFDTQETMMKLCQQLNNENKNE